MATFDKTKAAIMGLSISAARIQREALDEAADEVVPILERNTPTDTRRLFGSAAKGKVRMKNGSRQVVIGYKGQTGSGAAGWRAHFPDTGTIYQPAQNISLHTQQQSEGTVKNAFVKKWESR